MKNVVTIMGALMTIHTGGHKARPYEQPKKNEFDKAL
jgi:hypothetical protein